MEKRIGSKTSFLYIYGGRSIRQNTFNIKTFPPGSVAYIQGLLQIQTLDNVKVTYRTPEDDLTVE